MEPLDVAIHLQDDFRACGQACAQMIARFLTGRLPQQTEMTSTVQSIVPWKTTPDQLADMINRHLPDDAPEYVVHDPDRAAVAMAVAKGSVDHPSGGRWPVAALVGGGAHWEVVQGFTSGRSEFVVHARNPLPDRELLLGAMPPDHTDTDRCDALNLASGASLYDEAVEGSRWFEIYFKRCVVRPGRWLGRFVIVAPEVEGIPFRLMPPKPGPLHLPLDSDAITTEVVLAGLTESGLLDLRSWKTTLTNLPANVAQPSLFVDFLHDPGAYRLVSVGKADGSGALVALDAITRRLMWARLNPPPTVLNSLFAERVEGRVVWLPCEESFYSMMFPFVEQRVNGTLRYVRLFDRKAFDVLTPDTEQ